MKHMEIKEIVNNYMKQLVFLIVFIQFTLGCSAQKDYWKHSRNWKIYALNNNEAYFYRVDTLANFPSAAMNDTTVISFLSRSTIWPKGKGGTWMGVYIASYETADKEVRKIVLSNYGGFLFDSWSRRYYELPKELRKEWNDFIMENLQKVFEQ
jgi:hypothetical protein